MPQHCRGCDRDLPGGNFAEGRLLCKTCVNQELVKVTFTPVTALARAQMLAGQIRWQLTEHNNVEWDRTKANQVLDSLSAIIKELETDG